MGREAVEGPASAEVDDVEYGEGFLAVADEDHGEGAVNSDLPVPLVGVTAGCGVSDGVVAGGFEGDGECVARCRRELVVEGLDARVVDEPEQCADLLQGVFLNTGRVRSAFSRVSDQRRCVIGFLGLGGAAAGADLGGFALDPLGAVEDRKSVV